MLSRPYLSVKSFKMDIFHTNITRCALFFPKVGEGVTRCEYHHPRVVSVEQFSPMRGKSSTKLTRLWYSFGIQTLNSVYFCHSCCMYFPLLYLGTAANFPSSFVATLMPCPFFIVYWKYNQGELLNRCSRHCTTWMTSASIHGFPKHMKWADIDIDYPVNTWPIYTYAMSDDTSIARTYGLYKSSSGTECYLNLSIIRNSEFKSQLTWPRNRVQKCSKENHIFYSTRRGKFIFPMTCADSQILQYSKIYTPNILNIINYRSLLVICL